MNNIHSSKETQQPMMENKNHGCNQFEINEIYILLFDIMGVKFGIDMDHIVEIHRPDDSNERYSYVLRFHELFDFGDRPISYPNPMIIDIKGLTVGILISQPIDINIPIPINTICPLPPLIQLTSKQKSLWGVVCFGNDLVFLLDPYKLKYDTN